MVMFRTALVLLVITALSGVASAGPTDMSVDLYAVDELGPLEGEFSCNYCLSESSTERDDCLWEANRQCTFSGGVLQVRLDIATLAGIDWPDSSYLWVTIDDRVVGPLTISALPHAVRSHLSRRALSLKGDYLTSIAGGGLAYSGGKLGVNLGTGLTVNATGVAIDTSVIPLRTEVPLLTADNSFTGANTFTVGQTFTDGLLTSGGNVGVGDASPDYSLEVADSELALSDADVAHGMTSVLETDVFAHLGPVHATRGGAQITGLSDTDSDGETALVMGGVAGTNGTGSIPITVVGAVKSGAGLTAVPDANVLFQVLNNTTPVFSVYGNAQTVVGNAAPVGKLSVYLADTTANILTTLRHSYDSAAANTQLVLVESRPSGLEGTTDFCGGAYASCITDWRLAVQGSTDLTSTRYFAIQRQTGTNPLTLATDFYIDKNGNIGVGGNSSPQSTLHVPDGKYLQAGDSNAGAPAAGDCDANTERMRISIDTTNNRLYVCNGATRGWDYIGLTD